MEYTLRYLELAKHDIREIKKYLTQFYPGTPARFLATLKEKIGNLARTPYMYEAYPDYPQYRKLGVSKYLVFYTVDDEKRLVEIYRVLHGARNIAQYLH